MWHVACAGDVFPNDLWSVMQLLIPSSSVLVSSHAVFLSKRLVAKAKRRSGRYALDYNSPETYLNLDPQPSLQARDHNVAYGKFT